MREGLMEVRALIPAFGGQLYAETVEAALANTSQAPAGGQAFLHPALVAMPMQVAVMRIRLAAGGSGSNYMLGIYDAEGGLLVTTGLVSLVAGTNVLSLGPVLLQPGMYWLAVSFGNSTPTVYRAVLGSGAQRPRSGYLSGAHPLPEWVDLAGLSGLNQVVWLQAAEA